MMRPALILVFFVMFAGTAGAQHSNGYVVVGSGGATCCGHTFMTLNLGAGGEAIVGKGVGAALEVGAVALRQAINDSALGVLSLNGYYHFVHAKDLKADPFVTGGYSLFIRQGHVNLFNFGGGLNYWFHRRLGARLDVRDHVHTPIHYWGFRVGLAFR